MTRDDIGEIVSLACSLALTVSLYVLLAAF